MERQVESTHALKGQALRWISNLKAGVGLKLGLDLFKKSMFILKTLSQIQQLKSWK